ncbi:MAG: sensor histidine kinase [Negativicutes bacterium]|nr:sensor histidine kinase [Negativicutes bacterium]
MARKKMSLQHKIMLLTISMVCFVLVTAGILVGRQVINEVQEDTAKRALDIARIVSQVPAVQEAILSENPSEVLQPLAERWRVATGASFIVIANMDQIRLSHTIASNVGTPMADLYREPVLHGEEYVYTGQGSLAPSLRANVPIYDAAGRQQIGFVSVGFSLDDIFGRGMAGVRQVFYALLGALLLSLLGAHLLARDVKKSIFGLEPHEIATLLKERIATFEAIREGIIAVDGQGSIRFLNSEAASILGLKPDEATGLRIDSILLEYAMDDIIYKGQAVADKEYRVNDIIIFANSVPVVVDGAVVGAVISFRDRTEIYRLAEEITGVHRLVEVMRAQSHEFKNKLHAVSGLIQLGRYSEAVDFLTANYAPDADTFEWLSARIKESLTFGLLLGKISRAKEQGVELSVLPETMLSVLPKHFSSGDMVLVLGNLVENAIEAAALSEEKQAAVGVVNQPEAMVIVVRNSGRSIDAELGNNIYRRGVTTKGDGRGYGLALVAEKVAMNSGTITFHNLAAGGVEFVVSIPN